MGAHLHGIESEAQARRALEEIERLISDAAAGGVLGSPVEYTSGDSGDASTDLASQTTDSLLAAGVDAIIGAASSSVSKTVIDKITPDSHVIDDLGIDSLDFLDIVFAIDKEFGIKVPVEKWTQDVNAGTAPAEQYFVMKNLAARVEELVAAKSA